MRKRAPSFAGFWIVMIGRLFVAIGRATIKREYRPGTTSAWSDY